MKRACITYHDVLEPIAVLAGLNGISRTFRVNENIDCAQPGDVLCCEEMDASRAWPKLAVVEFSRGFATASAKPDTAYLWAGRVKLIIKR